jgi:hypothetical protein
MRQFFTLIFVACFLLSPITKAQSKKSNYFAHSAGFIFFGATEYFSAGVVYSPRINFLILSEKSTFSVGTHLGLGANFNYSSDSRGNSSSSSSYAVDLPLMIEYNFGNAATRNANTKFGGFAGAGYGWHNATRGFFTTYTGSAQPEDADLHISGLAVNAGFRFPLGRTSFGIRAGYLFNNSLNNPDVNGVGSFAIEFNIGTWIKKKR